MLLVTVLSEGHKNYFKDWHLINSQPTSLFLSYLNSVNYGHINKGCKIFKNFVPILLNSNFSLNETLLTFLLCVTQTWITELILEISL